MKENYKTNEIECNPKREPISVEVAMFAERLANRAQALSERVNGKLHPVMTSEQPRPCEIGNGKDVQEYPPLFSDLRNNFQSISSALDSIEYAMSRTEL